jgi:hypothetical protein
VWVLSYWQWQSFAIFRPSSKDAAFEGGLKGPELGELSIQSNTRKAVLVPWASPATSVFESNSRERANRVETLAGL